MPEDIVDLARLADRCTDPALAREIHRGYLQWFEPGARVLDVGCGRGGFLDELRESGRRAVGIERSAAALAACRERGHEVAAGDALRVLAGLRQRGERFDGALLAHVIEHLDAEQAARWLSSIAAVLRDGAPLVVVTPNFKNLIVATELFWLDPTHVRPYPRMVIEELGHAVGFGLLAGYEDPLTVPRRTPVRRLLARVRSMLSGSDRSSPLDLVVVLRKAD